MPHRPVYRIAQRGVRFSIDHGWSSWGWVWKENSSPFPIKKIFKMQFKMVRFSAYSELPSVPIPGADQAFI